MAKSSPSSNISRQDSRGASCNRTDGADPKNGSPATLTIRRTRHLPLTRLRREPRPRLDTRCLTDNPVSDPHATTELTTEQTEWLVSVTTDADRPCSDTSGCGSTPALPPSSTQAALAGRPMPPPAYSPSSPAFLSSSLAAFGQSRARCPFWPHLWHVTFLRPPPLPAPAPFAD